MIVNLTYHTNNRLSIILRSKTKDKSIQASERTALIAGGFSKNALSTSMYHTNNCLSIIAIYKIKNRKCLELNVATNKIATEENSPTLSIGISLSVISAFVKKIGLLQYPLIKKRRLHISNLLFFWSE